jgi:hypothetical protein
LITYTIRSGDRKSQAGNQKQVVGCRKVRSIYELERDQKEKASFDEKVAAFGTEKVDVEKHLSETQEMKRAVESELVDSKAEACKARPNRRRRNLCVAKVKYSYTYTASLKSHHRLRASWIK